MAEHRGVDLAEVLGLDARSDDRVDLLIARPDVLERIALPFASTLSTSFSISKRMVPAMA